MIGNVFIPTAVMKYHLWIYAPPQNPMVTTTWTYQGIKTKDEVLSLLRDFLPTVQLLSPGVPLPGGSSEVAYYVRIASFS